MGKCEEIHLFEGRRGKITVFDGKEGVILSQQGEELFFALADLQHCFCIPYSNPYFSFLPPHEHWLMVRTVPEVGDEVVFKPIREVSSDGDASLLATPWGYFSEFVGTIPKGAKYNL